MESIASEDGEENLSRELERAFFPCPKCGKNSRLCKYTRSSKTCYSRDRQCGDCGHTFHTTEMLGYRKDDSGIMPLFPPDVENGNGQIEEFSKERLEASIASALGKIPCPDPMPMLVNRIASILYQDKKRVTLSEIVDTTARELGSSAGAVAALHYLSRYRDVSELREKFGGLFADTEDSGNAD